MTIFAGVPQQSTQNIDVLLISMPFGLLAQPSIGLGLLHAHLKSFDVSSKVLYFTLPFAKTIGVSLYNYIANGEPATVDQLGEWLFSAALFQNDPDSADGYIDNILLGADHAHRSTNPTIDKVVSQELIDAILQARTTINAFLDACVEHVLQHQPKIVGFTSLFQQHLASLALAQRLNVADPNIKIIFGGANCEGAMGAELVRQFRFVDAVISGEADRILRTLIERLLEKKQFHDIPGVYTYENTHLVDVGGVYPNAPSVTAMDALPYPDYSDYFCQKAMLGFDFPSNVLFETSRGCWWGQVNHCTFCGLNGLTMAFRSKSADRALAELLYLRDTHPGCPVVLVDNILDMKYFKTFIPRLAALELDLKLFYEVKANLKKEQLRLLRCAGITTIQPGIESFSTQILEIMHKGVRALQNIQLLKWCKELDIEPLWNFLWGFPDEDPKEYQLVSNLIPLLTHLPPPICAQQIHLDRFSPLFDAAQRCGLANVRPYPSYSYIYPSLPPNSVASIAYYFTYTYQERRNVGEYVAMCAQRIREWKHIHRTSELYVIPTESEVLIWDFRPVSQGILTRLTGLERAIYLACDTVRSLGALRAIMEQHLGSAPHEEARTMLQQFIDRNLMIGESNSYLSLAIILPDGAPKREVFATMLQAMEAGGRMPDYFRITEHHPARVLPQIRIAEPLGVGAEEIAGA